MSEEKKGVAALIGSMLGLVAVGVVCAVIGWIVRDMMPEKPKPESPQAEAMKKMALAPKTVSVRKAELRPYSNPQKYIAHAEPVAEVGLVPQVDGFIEKVCFKEGDLVKKDDLLYVLNDERYRAVVEQRKAELAKAESALLQARLYNERMQKADARGVTALERDNAATGEQSAKAAVKEAEANLSIAEYDLGRAVVKAPITGQIGKTFVHEGDYVSPAKGELARIVQLDPIRVIFPMPDREYYAWRDAQRAGRDEQYLLRLMLPTDGAEREYEHLGAWDFNDNKMSRETGTINMRLLFANPDRVLMPNLSATLVKDSKAAPDVPHVPNQAIMFDPDGQKGVFVKTPDGRARWREVEAGESIAGWVAVPKGVSAGEEVIVSGLSKLADGVPVMVIPATDNDDLTPGYTSRLEEKK